MIVHNSASYFFRQSVNDSAHFSVLLFYEHCAYVRDSHRQTQQPGIDLLIDIQNRALGKGAGYERWAKGFNLKQTAKTLLFLQQHDIHTYEDLERMTSEAVTGADQLLDRLFFSLVFFDLT